MIDYAKLAEQFYGEFQHPVAPSIKVRDYPMAVKLATATKMGGHASPQEAAAFWREFEPLGMSPENYLHLLKQIAPLSYRYLNRPPTIKEIADHRDKSPKEVHDYFYNQPDPHRPDVPAGEMVRYLEMANPIAVRHTGTYARKQDAAMHYHARHGIEHIESHYKGMAEEKNGLQGAEGGHAGVLGPGAPGRPTPGPRTPGSWLERLSAPTSGGDGRKAPLREQRPPSPTS